MVTIGRAGLGAGLAGSILFGALGAVIIARPVAGAGDCTYTFPPEGGDLHHPRHRG